MTVIIPGLCYILHNTNATISKYKLKHWFPTLVLEALQHCTFLMSYPTQPSEVLRSLLMN